MFKKVISLPLNVLFLFAALNCSNNEEASPSDDTTDIPEVYKKIYASTDMYVQGDYIYIGRRIDLLVDFRNICGIIRWRCFFIIATIQCSKKKQDIKREGEYFFKHHDWFIP